MQRRPRSKDPLSHSQDINQQIFVKISSVFSLSFSSSSFRTLCKNRYNLHIHCTCFNLAEIWHTYWGSKGKYQHKILINNEGVISNVTQKAKSNFCHTYRVNRFKEQAKNWYVAGLNIRGVPFGG